MLLALLVGPLGQLKIGTNQGKTRCILKYLAAAFFVIQLASLDIIKTGDLKFVSIWFLSIVTIGIVWKRKEIQIRWWLPSMFYASLFLVAISVLRLVIPYSPRIGKIDSNQSWDGLLGGLAMSILFGILAVLEKWYLRRQRGLTKRINRKK